MKDVSEAHSQFAKYKLNAISEHKENNSKRSFNLTVFLKQMDKLPQHLKKLSGV